MTRFRQTLLFSGAMWALATPATASLLRIDYNATLVGTCLVASCNFGTSPDGWSVMLDEELTVDLSISFQLDSTDFLYDVDFPETIPGTSTIAGERLVGYGLSAVSDFSASLAGVALSELDVKPQFGGEYGAPIVFLGFPETGSLAALGIEFDVFGDDSLFLSGAPGTCQRGLARCLTGSPLVRELDATGDPAGTRLVGDGDPVITATAVAAPGSTALLLLGLAALGGRRDSMALAPRQRRSFLPRA